MKKPEPVAKETVCSLCGLDWKKHGRTPTAEKCVELLKAELARRPLPSWFNSPVGTSVTAKPGFNYWPNVS